MLDRNALAQRAEMMAAQEAQLKQQRDVNRVNIALGILNSNTKADRVTPEVVNAANAVLLAALTPEDEPQDPEGRVLKFG